MRVRDILIITMFAFVVFASLAASYLKDSLGDLIQNTVVPLVVVATAFSIALIEAINSRVKGK